MHRSPGLAKLLDPTVIFLQQFHNTSLLLQQVGLGGG
jgi:hypothetical protein